MEHTFRLVVLLGFVSSTAVGAESVTVTDIAGAKKTGTLKSWTPETLVVESSGDISIPRRNLRAVTFERASLKVPQRESTIWLSNGDRISARAVTAADDVLTISWPIVLEPALGKIPLEQIAAMIFEWPVDLAERLRLIADLQTLPAGSDLVLLTNNDRSLGEFERLDAALVELKVGANRLKLDRSRIRAIRFNPELTNRGARAERRMIVTMIDGSQLAVTSIELVDDKFVMQSPGLGKLTIAASSFVACELYGDRLVPISDYEPAKVEFTPYFSADWPLIRTANVRRGPLKLRGTEFLTGLGMHSRTAVTYNLTGREQEFRAIVGIDDLAQGNGSALFAVDVDGQRAWTSQELTGRSGAVTVPTIDLRGHKQLTLSVDYGELGDVSDYADWCDAVLIMDPNR